MPDRGLRGEAADGAADGAARGMIDPDAAAHRARRVAAKPYEAAQELSEAAVEWWIAHRPLDYSEADHFENPSINCVGEIENRLAVCVADVLRTERDV